MTQHNVLLPIPHNTRVNDKILSNKIVLLFANALIFVFLFSKSTTTNKKHNPDLSLSHLILLPLLRLLLSLPFVITVPTLNSTATNFPFNSVIRFTELVYGLTPSEFSSLKPAFNSHRFLNSAFNFLCFR